MSETIETDVIVAGAGPVGLVAALALAEQGVNTVLIEKRASLNTASKASTFHPATLEILESLGLLKETMAEGEIVRRIEYRTPEGPFAEFAMSDIADRTPFPFRLHLEQARLTPVALRRVEALPNARVIFDAGFRGVEQTGDGVVVTAAHGGRDLKIAARYLIGADGARSTVREALGIGFEGSVYPDKILRVMTTDDLTEVLPGLASIAYLFNGKKSLSFLKMPDCWRIIIRVPASVDDETALHPDWLAERLTEVLPRWTTPPHVVDKDVYGVAKRVASAYRQGRAYLVGDAAHITNTRGGMNMNCGIHDAYALAGAMARALRENRPELAEAASDERRRVAEEMLIPRTDRNVSGGEAWLDTVRALAGSRQRAADYLATAAMLDMVERPKRAA